MTEMRQPDQSDEDDFVPDDDEINDADFVAEDDGEPELHKTYNCRSTQHQTQRQRPICKYGVHCYRKNKQHFIDFAHPHLEKTSQPQAEQAQNAVHTPDVQIETASSTARFLEQTIGTTGFNEEKGKQNETVAGTAFSETGHRQLKSSEHNDRMDEEASANLDELLTEFHNKYNPTEQHKIDNIQVKNNKIILSNL